MGRPNKYPPDYQKRAIALAQESGRPINRSHWNSVSVMKLCGVGFVRMRPIAVFALVDAD